LKTARSSKECIPALFSIFSFVEIYFGMNVLNFMFQLGVLFAIFGFIFTLFEWLFQLFRGKKSLLETYIIKAIKYLLLVDVTFLFCLDQKQGQINYQQLGTAALILLFYFIGRLQNQQQQRKFMRNLGGMGGMVNNLQHFDVRLEILTIVLSTTFFILLIFMPHLSANSIAEWFRISIQDIAETSFFGFIFNVIGFFFLLGILFRMVGSFIFLLSGKAFVTHSEEEDHDSFDEYEEIEDEKLP
jgi:hypothetical protein